MRHPSVFVLQSFKGRMPGKISRKTHTSQYVEDEIGKSFKKRLNFYHSRKGHDLEVHIYQKLKPYKINSCLSFHAVIFVKNFPTLLLISSSTYCDTSLKMSNA